MSTLTADAIHRSPNALAPHYTRFNVAHRLLLTGHSHQAWPDCGFQAQQRAWLDAATYVDGKWDHAFAQADRVRRGFAELLDDRDGTIALAQNTHELVVRLLSALPLRRRPRILTTSGEFHTIRRQLDRLAEEGLEVVKVPGEPAASLASRLAELVDDRTAIVMVSSVLFETAHLVAGLGDLYERCRRAGAELLVDAYHGLNVVPFSVRQERLQGAFVVGGGYKYCQLGEGNCFLRLPPDCTLRPVITGWYSEFTALAEKAGEKVTYGQGGDRFAGATYDPTSHYRAAAVFDFFGEQGLTPEFLRQVSQHQVGLLANAFDRLDADPKLIARDHAVPLAETGGFLALHSPRAAELQRQLQDCGVLTDSRGHLLRLGPAPYLSDEQLTAAMGILGDLLRGAS